MYSELNHLIKKNGQNDHLGTLSSVIEEYWDKQESILLATNLAGKLYCKFLFHLVSAYQTIK